MKNTPIRGYGVHESTVKPDRSQKDEWSLHFGMQLNIRVIEAKGLAKMDTLGKSDPYVVLQLVGAHDTLKTSIKENTLAPVWNEVFKFPLYNPSRQALTLKLRDQDVALDEDMALTEISIASIPIGTAVDKWYDLQAAKGASKGGEIHLVLHVGLPDGAPFAPYAPPAIGAGPYLFHVRVIAAEGFEKMDLLGKTDAFVVVSSGSQNFKTEVQPSSLTPRWDKDFQLQVPDPRNQIVKLTLCDEDPLLDDNISSCELQIGIFPFGKVLDAWIELTPTPKVKKGGKLHILAQVASESAPAFVSTA
jgi:Ca2+-dependent lipid-binding protein